MCAEFVTSCGPSRYGVGVRLSAGQAAHAQDYPNRPIRVVIAFPAGGPTDFVGRLMVDKMSALLGQRVYIENRAGRQWHGRRR